MPQLSLNKTGGQIIYSAKDWLGGMSYIGTSPAPQIPDKPIKSATNINPFFRRGAIMPGRSFTNVSNPAVITDALCAYSQYGMSVYLMSRSNAKIHKLTDYSVNTLASTTPFPHTVTISGVSPVGSDTIFYDVAGTKYLFYSTIDQATGNGHVGRYNMDGTAAGFKDDFMATNSAGGGPDGNSGSLLDATTSSYSTLPMVVGADDILYIGNANQLHAYDGASGNGTLSKNVLTLPRQQYIVAFAKVDNGLVLFTNKKNNHADTTNNGCTAWFWDYLSKDPFKVVDLEEDSIMVAFNWRGTIGIFTYTQQPTMVSSKNYKIKLFDGSKFQTIAEVDSAPTYADGLSVHQDYLMWTGVDTNTKVYLFGKVHQDLEDTYQCIGLSTGTAAQLCFQAQGDNYIYITDGNSLKRQIGAFGEGSIGTSRFEIPTSPGRVGKITKITAEYYGAASEGLQVEMILSNDISSNSSVFSNVKNVTATVHVADGLIKQYSQLLDGTPFPTFSALSFTLSWTTGGVQDDAPCIKSIIVEYEYLNITQ